MNERTIKLSLQKAKEWYNSDNQALKDVALQAFSKEELIYDITEKIKTFEDACLQLGCCHPLVIHYNTICHHKINETDYLANDLIAYLKLRIICTALNEGWEPKFSRDEYRYYPWFYLYTKDEYNKLSKKEQQECILLGGTAYDGAAAGFSFARSDDAPTTANAYFGSRLCLKTGKLAKYCGRQFVDIWYNFLINK